MENFFKVKKDFWSVRKKWWYVSALIVIFTVSLSIFSDKTLAVSVPGEPEIVNYSVGNTTVNLVWTPPSSNGGSVITDYKVEYKLSVGSSWTVVNIGSTATFKSIRGLTNGSSYDFRVSAINASGAGASSEIVSATPVLGYDVTSSGANGTDLVDDTAAIQDALDNHDNVYIPAGTYMINADSSLNLKSNQTLTMDNNAILKMITTTRGNTPEDTYNVITISNVSNVNVVGGQIVGDRDTHTPPAEGAVSEFGYGINVKNGASFVSINGTNISDCWGDGIFLGVDGTLHDIVTDVVINDVISENNRRQGLSVVVGRRVFVLNSIFRNTNGVAPQAGIDLEPSASWHYISDILLSNIQSYGNNGDGLLIYGTRCKLQNITINDSNFSGNNLTSDTTTSYAGLKALYVDGLRVNNLTVSNNRHGIILSTDVTNGVFRSVVVSENERRGISLMAQSSLGTYNLLFEDCIIRNNSQSTLGIDDGVIIEVESSGSGYISDVYFNRCSFIDDQSTPTQKYGLFVDTTERVSNVVLAASTFSGNLSGDYHTSGSPITVTSTAITVPGVPTSLSATAGDSQVSLSWSAPSSNGGSVITDYKVEYKLSVGSSWTVVNIGSTATTKLITGLTNGSSYDFKVSATNLAGTGTASSTTSATPVAAITYVLTYSRQPNGSIVGDSPQIVPIGGSGTSVLAVGNSGYTFLQWSDGSLNNPRVDIGVTGDISVSAEFTNTRSISSGIGVTMANEISNGFISIGSSELTDTTDFTFNINYLFSENNASAVFPVDTVVSRSDGGSFNLNTFGISNNFNQIVSGRSDVLGSVKIGIPDYGLTFSKNITVTIPVNTSFNDQTLRVFYRNEGSSNWLQETTCLVSNGSCSFQTNHATTFAVVQNEVISNNNSSSSSSSPASPPGPSVCTDSRPLFIPDLFQINASKNSAKLYFTPLNDTNGKYYISFSAVNSNAEEHGEMVTLMREGVQSHTIYKLKPNTTYYVKVRGQNGCMSGEWSTIMKFKTSSKTKIFYKYTGVKNLVKSVLKK